MDDMQHPSPAICPCASIKWSLETHGIINSTADCPVMASVWKYHACLCKIDLGVRQSLSLQYMQWSVSPHLINGTCSLWHFCWSNQVAGLKGLLICSFPCTNSHTSMNVPHMTCHDFITRHGQRAPTQCTHVHTHTHTHRWVYPEIPMQPFPVEVSLSGWYNYDWCCDMTASLSLFASLSQLHDCYLRLTSLALWNTVWLALCVHTST